MIAYHFTAMVGQINIFWFYIPCT